MIDFSRVTDLDEDPEPRWNWGGFFKKTSDWFITALISLWTILVVVVVLYAAAMSKSK